MVSEGARPSRTIPGTILAKVNVPSSPRPLVGFQPCHPHRYERRFGPCRSERPYFPIAFFAAATT
jgi:hypothetical protein